MTSNLEPQEYLNSASALMQLGRQDETQGPVVPVTDVVGAEAVVGGPEQPWPLMIFDAGQGAG